MRTIFARSYRKVNNANRDESGSEMVAMIFVLPFLIVLVFALFDLGIMFSTRFYVTNVIRDATRNVAIYGGDEPLYGPMRGSGTTFSGIARDRLWKNGRCAVGLCSAAPEITCVPDTVDQAGALVKCTVLYHYKGMNTELVGGSMGIGIGKALGDFTVSSEAYAEVGVNGVEGLS
jgi:hypothetical protein